MFLWLMAFEEEEKETKFLVEREAWKFWTFPLHISAFVMHYFRYDGNWIFYRYNYVLCSLCIFFNMYCIMSIICDAMFLYSLVYMLNNKRSRTISNGLETLSAPHTVCFLLLEIILFDFTHYSWNQHHIVPTVITLQISTYLPSILFDFH
jgi:hypothetical protein